MKIRIESPKIDGKPGPYLANGTRIWLDDQELHEVGDIVVKYPARSGPVSVELLMFATETLNLESNAEVHITVQAFPNYEIEAREVDDGVMRYSCRYIDPKGLQRP